MEYPAVFQVETQAKLCSIELDPQNLYTRSRHPFKIYSVAKVFIEELHESTLLYYLLHGIIGMFFEELFTSNLDNDLIIAISKVFIEQLFDQERIH